jgi:hypothetical protein
MCLCVQRGLVEVAVSREEKGEEKPRRDKKTTQVPPAPTRASKRTRS